MQFPGHFFSRFFLGALGVLAVYLLFFHRLADRDLWSSHEARAAMDSQTILDDDAWLLPHLFDGQPELQKPPLYYWLVALIAEVRGGTVNAWAVRLPSALAALGCVLIVMVIGWWRGRPLAGLLAGMMLTSAVHFVWLARIGRIDLPLAFCTSLACGAFFLARGTGRATYQPEALARSTMNPSLTLPVGRGKLALLLVGYLALAAGALLKGPIGILLPLAVVALYLLLEREIPAPWRLRAWWQLARVYGLWWGLPLVAVLTVPWFWWVNERTQGAFFRVFFWHHNFERALGGSTLRSHPWWLYVPYFANDFLPWTVLLPPAVYLCLRRGPWRADPIIRFGGAWFLAVLVVLSCSAFKRADYLVPAYPGAALFLGGAIAHWLAEQRQRGHLRRAAFGLGVMLTAFLGAVAGWTVYVCQTLPARERYYEHRTFAEAVRHFAPRPEDVLFFRAEVHGLAFHVGRPLTVLVQWPDLKTRLTQAGTHYVVMPPEAARDWPRHLDGVRLEELARNVDLAGGAHQKPLILFRTTDLSPPSEHARAAETSADCFPTAQRGAVGPSGGTLP
jgi:4-amino-4-deoxy-L-arabinose transferase-like glycosyltransferase